MSNVEKIIHYKFDDDFPEKAVSLCVAQTLEELPALITPSGPHFILFIAMDATDTRNDAILAVAERLLIKGQSMFAHGGRNVEKSRTSSTSREFNAIQMKQTEML